MTNWSLADKNGLVRLFLSGLDIELSILDSMQIVDELKRSRDAQRGADGGFKDELIMQLRIILFDNE